MTTSHQFQRCAWLCTNVSNSIKLQKIIPIGTRFAEGGIYNEYRDVWSEFVYELHEAAKQFLIDACQDKINT